MRKLFVALAALFVSATVAVAQPSNPGVTQSGAVTANHLSVWSANRVVKDGGAVALIFSGLPNCNLWGAVPFVGSGGNIACLDPTGQSGKVFTSNDVGADPSFTSASGVGTVTSQGATSTGNTITITATSGANPNTSAAVFNFECATFTAIHAGCVPAGSGANNVIHGDGSFGNVVAGDIASNAVTTAKILAANVTYAKIQNVTDARLLGNATGGAAAPSEISADSSLSLASSTLGIATNGVTTAKINNAAVTYAKIQNVTDARLLGNATGGAAAPSEISVDSTLALASSSLGRAAISGDVTVSAASNTATVTKVNGIAYSATAAIDTVPVTTTANTTSTYKALPSCTTANNALQYNTSTHAFSCVAMGLGYQLSRVVNFTASGTLTIAAGETAVYFEGWGPGGSGGSVTGTASNTAAAGGGGGGSCSRVFLTSLNGPYTVTIGTGGAAPSTGNNPGNAGSGPTTVVDNGSTTRLSAAAGNGGGAHTAGTTAGIGGGGGTSPGTSDVGDWHTTGSAGQAGIRLNGTDAVSGMGGNAGCIGLGGGAQRNTTDNALGAGGIAGATNSGAGGSGALSGNGTARAGGAGADGGLLAYVYKN